MGPISRRAIDGGALAVRVGCRGGKGHEPEGCTMNLSSLLARRAATRGPVRVGIIGVGKFGSMILAQAQRIAGLHVVGVADLDVGRARASFKRVFWPEECYSAKSLADAAKTAATCVIDDSAALLACPDIECVIEATGHPIAGVRHALQAIEHGKHIIMVNVEADVMCGPILAERARASSVIYSMAYGDQPAIMCELVDWVRACGFELTSAGKGMNFEPRFRYPTPDTVWG
jgi:predicted homoserine dehydrogenase-like protein